MIAWRDEVAGPWDMYVHEVVKYIDFFVNLLNGRANWEL